MPLSPVSDKARVDICDTVVDSQMSGGTQRLRTPSALSLLRGINTDAFNTLLNEVGQGNIFVGNTSDKVAVTRVLYPTQGYFTFGISDEDASKFTTGFQREFCICMKDDQTNIWWVDILSG